MNVNDETVSSHRICADPVESDSMLMIVPMRSVYPAGANDMPITAMTAMMPSTLPPPRRTSSGRNSTASTIKVRNPPRENVMTTAATDRATRPQANRRRLTRRAVSASAAVRGRNRLRISARSLGFSARLFEYPMMRSPPMKAPVA